MAKKKQELSSEELLEQALVREEDWPFKVPGNWVWTRLGSVVELKRGASPRPISHFITDDKDGINWIKIGDADTGKYIISTKQKIRIEGKTKSVHVEKGTLLLSNSMSFGRPYILNIDGCIHDGWLAIKSNEYIDKDFLFYALQSSDWYFESVAVGTAVRNLNLERVSGLPLPLPPLAEQQRIVDRIESLFDKLDQAKDLIQEALDSFETRKAAILHQAFTGELTKKWREAHSNMRNTTLYDIKEYAEGLPKKQKNQILNAQEFVKIKELNDGNIWYECTIGAAGLVTNGSTPSRACLKYWNGDIPWVSSGEVRNNIIDFSKECITQNGYENSSVKLLPKGTVLIAMIGEGKTRGQSAVLDISATTNQNIAAIIIDHGYISSNFLWYWLQKEYQNNREKGNGTGPQALNCQRVRELKFVLPSFLEQQEIVGILDVLFAKEQNAKDLIDLIDQIESIKKTILGQAFRGELGTNEAGEESAMELLKDVLMSK